MQTEHFLLVLMKLALEELCKPFARFLGMAFEVVAIVYVDKSKSVGVTLIPLKVVCEGPSKVALHIHSTPTIIEQINVMLTTI